MKAKDFFLSNHTKIKFGTAQAFGKGIEHGETPDFDTNATSGESKTRCLASLSENLKKVKWEVSGEYKR